MPIIVPGEAIRSGEIRDPLAELYYLPIFYLFPAELLARSEFADFPRTPHVVLDTPKWREIYHSDKFTEAVTDGVAGMVWKHFGIKAPMEDFSGYYPFWILARTGTWIDIAAKMGANTISIARASPQFQFPILSWERAEENFGAIVARFRQQNPLDEWIAAVRQHPAHEDYEPSRHDRRVYKDFLRKWNHSRSKWVQPASVTTGEEWNKLNDPALLSNPYHAVDFKLDFEGFQQSLPETERHIVPLLAAGHTQAQIAEALGYANHSAVSKKVKKITHKYREYMKTDDTESIRRNPSNNWDEMTRLLFPKAKPR